jgi:inorganic triphosphatase YgiF
MTRSDNHPASLHRASPLSAKLEREYKLAVARDFHLPRLPGVPLPRRLVISTYYDTAAYHLAHARITLRYRIERGKKVWQLKIP